ncbi:MAG: Ig-like domain-containing protein, partial [Gemmatimonadaceae bacterium]
TVVGDLVVFGVAGANRVIPNVRLRTFEGDDLRFAGVYGVGPALRYVGEVLREDGTPVQGAQVTWTQVSGIPASPATLTVTTDASGRFPLTLIPSMDGEVVGTVRVTPPAPWAAGTAFTFTNLRLNSFESGELRLAVTYRIPAP